MIGQALLEGLPGESLVRAGVADLLAQRRTIAALVVSVARARLARAGVVPEHVPRISEKPELDLYDALRSQPGDAYSRYNALIRELVSFVSALDHRLHSTARR